MAERRMFAKTIIDSDAFLDMPLSTQALYFHLSMRGDDDGFINNPKKIQRMVGATEDDLKLLIAKRFIIPFESGIVVIKHWKIHNYIRNDRYKETVYKEEKSLLTLKDNNSYSLTAECQAVGIPSDSQAVYQMDTQDRLGKDRLGKDSKKNILSGNPTLYRQIVDLFHEQAKTLPRVRSLNESRKAKIRNLLKEYTVDDFETVFRKVDKSDFLSGRSGKWTACSFDWILKPSNFLKVIEGNYDNKKSKEVDALKAWAEGEIYGQEGDSETIDVDSIFLSETG